MNLILINYRLLYNGEISISIATRENFIGQSQYDKKV